MEGKTKTLGGSALLVGGAILARETFSWAWNGVLNLLTAGAADRVSWSTFPWANAAGIVLMIAGVCVLAWHPLRRRLKRSSAAPADPHAQQIFPPTVEHSSEFESEVRRDFRDLYLHLHVLIAPMVAQVRVQALKKMKVPVIEWKERDEQMKDYHRRMFGSAVDPGAFLSHLTGMLGNYAPGGKQAIQEEINEKLARIRADAAYLLLTDDDKKYWDTGEEKRHWHMIRARMEVLYWVHDRELKRWEQIAARGASNLDTWLTQIEKRYENGFDKNGRPRI